MRLGRDIVATLLILGALTIAVAFVNDRNELAGLAKVVDGDTILLGNARIRLEGIDAFELSQTCGSYPCGRLARQVLRDLVRGKSVRCDVEGTDRYGRGLGRCYVDDTDVGAEMVGSGLALSRSYSYDDLEDSARATKKGAWAHAVQDPREFRRDAGSGTSLVTEAVRWLRELIR